MLPPDSTAPATLPPGGRVHILGAGPVGLMLTALLQSTEGFSVRLYEKRREYTRTRLPCRTARNRNPSCLIS